MKKKLLALCLAASLISMNAMSVLAAENMPIPTEDEEAVVVAEDQTHVDEGSELSEDAAVMPETQAETTEETDTEETEAEETEAEETEGTETEGTETPESDVVDSGKCPGRDIIWTLTGDGVLTFSGTGEIDMYSDAIDKTQVTSIVIEDGITSIAMWVFSLYSNVTSVTLPNSLTSIGDNAFNRCTSLTSVTIPDGVTSIGYGVFYFCSSLTNVTIPDSVTSIGDSSFMGCSSLTSIAIPGNVTEIGSSAFYLCSALTSVTIPDGVTEIGRHAFRECTSLTSVTIPGSVTSIGSWAFMDCSALTDVVISDGVTSIGFNAFNGCSALTNVKLPKTVTTIEYRAFANCTGLAQVSIPDSVKAIEYQAFGDCTNLSAVTFEGDAPELQERYTYMNWDDWKEGIYERTYAGSIFQGVTAIVIYPKTNATWTSEVMKTFSEGANLTWVTDVIDPENTNLTYDPASGDSVTIRCVYPLEDFVSVTVDGEVVDPTNYTLQEGSTILTFTKAYLDTLSEGEHSVTMMYKGGISVSVPPLVISNEPSKPDDPGTTDDNAPAQAQDNNEAPTSPKTGDAADLWVWMAVLAVLSGSVLTCSKLYRTHRQ